MGYISKNRHKFYPKFHLIFVCSIGEANPDTIRKYIENQG